MIRSTHSTTLLKFGSKVSFNKLRNLGLNMSLNLRLNLRLNLILRRGP
jgi:hypothetical protein